MFLWEKRWSRIIKEGGSVEVAIRAMGHILEPYDVEDGKEIRQIYESLDRINQVADLLAEYEPGMPREDFNRLFAHAARETAALFKALGMEEVKDPAKQRIIKQLLKASEGKDSLGRPNPLIMATRLNSARRLALERLEKTNFILTKYHEMKVALTSARRTDRYLLDMIKERLSVEIFGHVAFRQPDRPTTPKQLGILSGKLRQVTETFHRKIHLKPYKTVSGEILKVLVPEARELIEEGNIRKAEEAIRKIQEKIDEVLETCRRIYPEELSSKTPITTPLAPGNG